MNKKLQEIKDNYTPCDSNYCLEPDDIEWLIEQADIVDKLKSENNWLYGKLNIISMEIERGRDESIKKFTNK